MAQKLELLLKSKSAKFLMCKQASKHACFFLCWMVVMVVMVVRFLPFFSVFLLKLLLGKTKIHRCNKTHDLVVFFFAAIDLVYTWAGNCSQATTSCSLIGNLQQRSSFVEVMAYLEQLRHVAGWLAKGDLWPDWEQESYPEFRDLALIPVFAVLFPTVRFFLDKFVFEVCIPSPGWLCLFFFPHT